MMLLFATLAILLLIVLKITSKKMKENLLTGLVIIAITFIIIPVVGTEILLGLPKESTIVSRDYISIHNAQDFTLTYYNGVYVFADGYGNCFVIPKEQVNIETFPDEELRPISISKAMIKECVSDDVIFWLDFGLAKRETNFKEAFEFTIPKSSLRASNENSFNINELYQKTSEQ